jgi:hypothetical protein
MRVRRAASGLAIGLALGLLLAATPSIVRAQDSIELAPQQPLTGLFAAPPAAEPPLVGDPLFDPAMGPSPSAPPGDYFDFDAWRGASGGPRAFNDDWYWQILPDGIVYPAYLADAKESRLGTQVFCDQDGGTLWDSTLGARVGILRYGTLDTAWPQGWQFDLEGSGQVRLDPDQERDLDAADFRAGGFLTRGYGPSRWRFGYYHISAHAGDEFLLKEPGFERINYVRDALSLGYAYYWTDNLRLYSDASWAFYGDYTGNWHFQFGVDYAPARPTGIRGAPFFAVNGHLRQELNYSGNLVVQAGWAWRGDDGSQLLRTGFHYYNGMSNQYSFFRQFEEQIGAGMWYDF